MEDMIVDLIKIVMKAASPEIVASMRSLVQEMKTRATQTENPWDDILAGLLEMSVGKPGDPIQ